ncbi:NADH-quinone oxidoreductase subunit A [Archaeoglobus veneficus]|uniref:NADH dehydrogenase subunit A n=1 Tax=Archaeoglobus veneficus (strain DSM 11195 / SNP6) TaxID=693661 RepID=F2KQB9_ARCVS|nr:NADH-quinone oxidoreductase subunit A [Archaeoglobus veneficus]AEA46552.1 NADH dehydrogenase subunit A [Archaeoglobus veneficus SNP6]
MTGIMDNIVIVGILIGLCIFIDAVIVLLAKTLTPKKPTPVKTQRFESGNMPIGIPKYVLPMQYVGFLILFLGCEPVVVLLLILAPLRTAIPLILLTLLMLIPAIAYSYRLACEAAYGGECA